MPDTSWGPEEQERLHWLLVAAYLLDTLALLHPMTAAKLASFEAAAGTEMWQEHVRQQLEVDSGSVTEVYKLCRSQSMDREGALCFLLRGFGCPVPELVLTDLARGTGY